MRISSFISDDLKELPDVQPMDWGDLMPIFKFYISSPFCYPVKITDDVGIAGVGAALFHKKTAWIGHIMVRPDAQGSGVGTKITQYIIDLIKQRNVNSIHLVSTPEGIALYKKLGFKRQWDYLFYQQPTVDIPQTQLRLVPAKRLELKDEIFDLDKLFAREDRSDLLRHFVHDALVACEADKVIGVYFPTLQEGLILSKDRDVGLELAKLRLKDRLRSVVPEQHEAVNQLMISCGMNILRRGVRMTLGKELKPQTDLLFQRIGGNLG